MRRSFGKKIVELFAQTSVKNARLYLTLKSCKSTISRRRAFIARIKRQGAVKNDSRVLGHHNFLNVQGELNDSMAD